MSAEQSDAGVLDVVVVGGGIAGLAASVRAAQLGLRVALLEKGADERYACNTRFSGGVIHTCYREVMKPESVLLEAIHQATCGFSREDLAEAIAQDGRRLVRWLQDQGIQFLKASAFEYHHSGHLRLHGKTSRACSGRGVAPTPCCAGSWRNSWQAGVPCTAARVRVDWSCRDRVARVSKHRRPMGGRWRIKPAPSSSPTVVSRAIRTCCSDTSRRSRHA